MAVASISRDRASTTGNTFLEIPIPAHTDGATAVAHVSVAGDVTPVTAPTGDWVEQEASYQANTDTTFITWTIDALLPAATATIRISWTGSAKASGVVGVSSNTTGLSQVGAVQANATLDDAGSAPGVVAVLDDLAIVVGGTSDVAAASSRYPDIASVSAPEITQLTYTNESIALIDAWIMTATAGLAAGATGAVTYTMLGTGSGPGSRQASQLVTFAAKVDGGPTIAFTTPAVGGGCVTDPVTLAGSAGDPSGVDTIDIEIIRSTDGLYWNGGSFVAGPVSVSATLGTPGGTTTTWTYNAAGAFVNPGSYTVRVTGTNLAASPASNTVVRSLCVSGPTATAIVRAARVGFGQDIEVTVVGRYGGVAEDAIVARLPVLSTSGYFDRRLDSLSEAEVSCLLSPLDLKRCGDNYGDIEEWAHELRFRWDGIEAWRGPIDYVDFTYDRLLIRARDRSVFWHNRTIDADIRHEQIDLATIFGDYHRNVYNQEPWGMTVVAKPVGKLGDRNVLASDGMVGWSGLSELARTGLDFTVYGTTLLIGGEEVPTSPLVTLSDRHFMGPISVVADGVLRSTDYVVSGGNQIAGRASLPSTNPSRQRYGLITGRAQERNINDQGSANQAARTRLDFQQFPVRPNPGSENTLRPSAPISMRDLVPGARIDINASATRRNAAGQFRLYKVRGNMDGSISIGLQPLGTTET